MANLIMALKKKVLQMVIPFSTSYLCKAGFSVMAVIKTKYRSRINIEKEMWVAVMKIFRLFDELCENKQAHISH